MSSDQLRFPVEPELPERRLPTRLAPMQPTPVDAPFDDPGYLFEPWWPGARAIAFVEAGFVRLQVEQLADPHLAFPELADLPAQLMSDAVVLDGTLLVLDAEGRPDPQRLRARLAGGRRQGIAAFLAADLLYLEGRSLLRTRYAARRQRLTAVLRDGDRVAVGRGYRRDGTLVAEALAALGLEALSARALDARYRSGPSRGAWVRAPIRAARPPDVRPTLALIQRLPLEVD